MGFDVRVDYGLSYEFLISLAAFSLKQTHKSLDLGTEWLKRVQGQLPHAFLTATKKFCPTGEAELGLLYPLVFQGPTSKEPTEFLKWLEQLKPGELYEMLRPFLANSGKGMDVEQARKLWVQWLPTWYERYFKAVQEEYRQPLQVDAKKNQNLLQTEDALVVFEQATMGMKLADPESATNTPGNPMNTPEHLTDPTVILVPQIHMSPWNTMCMSPGFQLYLYPIDTPAINEDSPPPRLLRVTRALSDESRLRILKLLAGGPATFTDIVHHTKLSKGTVSHHLVILRAAGLVIVQVAGGRNDMHKAGRDGKTETQYFLNPRITEYITERIESFLGRG